MFYLLEMNCRCYVVTSFCPVSMSRNICLNERPSPCTMLATRLTRESEKLPLHHGELSATEKSLQRIMTAVQSSVLVSEETISYV
jgi:hypothetical protein